MKSVNIDEKNCRKKVPINKLTSAGNPRANGSNVLAYQNARFAKAMLENNLVCVLQQNSRHMVDFSRPSWDLITEIGSELCPTS